VVAISRKTRKMRKMRRNQRRILKKPLQRRV